VTRRAVALVTGAGRGIGKACAQRLAADGFRTVLVDVDAEAVKQAAAEIGDGALGIAADLGDGTAVAPVFDRVEAEVGDVTVLVNNAGLAIATDFLELSLADWARTLDVNLTGAFLATQRAARTMVDKGISGSVVNMSSINAQVAIPNIAAYCASKGGLAQLTKAAALALAPHGIRVNAVGPGSIDTAMLAGVNADPSATQRILSRTPLKRFGTADEIAAVVAFLAGPGASYITGETIFADGGRLALNYTC